MQIKGLEVGIQVLSDSIHQMKHLLHLSGAEHRRQFIPQILPVRVLYYEQIRGPQSIVLTSGDEPILKIVEILYQDVLYHCRISQEEKRPIEYVKANKL